MAARRFKWPASRGSGGSSLGTPISSLASFLGRGDSPIWRLAFPGAPRFAILRARMSEDQKIPAPQAAAMTPAGSSRRINARAAGVVGLAVMCSRVLGLARELILAKLFGASFAMDAFYTAFRVP